MTKNSLGDALSKAAARTPHFGRTKSVPHLNQPGPIDHRGTTTSGNVVVPKPQRSPGRVGEKVISGFFDPEVSKQLARLAIAHDRSNEDLLREALNDLFTKYLLPPIA